MALRSNEIITGLERAPQRAYLNALGLPRTEFSKPFIGVVNTWNEVSLSNCHLNLIVQSVKAGILAGGGVPFEFNTIAVSDGYAEAHDGMNYVLASRELIADSIEIMALAHRFGGEVVSVDSMQIYRGMAIGTAAPTPEEMEGIPHHMVGVADPAESWSVARFVSEADVCVQDILRRGRRPILVGGTGLYLESLIRGTDFAAGSAGGVTRQRLQQRLEQEGVGPLLAELQTIDPDSAARLHPGDEKRILRALEVWYETGETITQHDHRTRQQPPRYRAAYIGLSFQDRAQLRRRIDLRVDEMVRQGLLEEVQALLAAGLPPTATAWQAIGYKQFLAAADGRCTVTEAIEEVKLRSRQYAKRQLTWLRRNPDIHWILWGEEPNFPQGLQNATEYLTALGLR